MGVIFSSIRGELLEGSGATKRMHGTVLQAPWELQRLQARSATAGCQACCGCFMGALAWSSAHFGWGRWVYPDLFFLFFFTKVGGGIRLATSVAMQMHMSTGGGQGATDPCSQIPGPARLPCVGGLTRVQAGGAGSTAGDMWGRVRSRNSHTSTPYACMQLPPVPEENPPDTAALCTPLSVGVYLCSKGKVRAAGTTARKTRMRGCEPSGVGTCMRRCGGLGGALGRDGLPWLLVVMGGRFLCGGRGTWRGGALSLALSASMLPGQAAAQVSEVACSTGPPCVPCAG